ncbi:glycerol-3-phosphate 1-O-acyltransferase PlsY [Pseudohalocynthiibacter aestuariivivens]|jgi:acyl phosphate:glycerol-3-phosphate acyltransferase|uniref:Glycerol-3-phosphate acyltransferase n=1 Tax=Pseudohalocynthiibacter aestuariivivens TaxID=1591409 RepID=A0ABV5JKD3_9RHOB|nr:MULTISPECIES: glycerol-3-phosphate 1-O-acyltransferase PlsY [Pseudohalocynthiibacter]MBS9717511.1 glycerol-3-phosphate 1-O-acyltransferase PlsY [Pseudohalocynthiibacter aestuariivivens]MCK0102153.1 glycerol-3-phosphate 1-O-acyltransferase PlsY [Pseudohalocynthiibacter sp. F2068]
MPAIVNSLQMLILAGVLGYLLGSVPFGMVVARVMGLGNLRDIGSGNIGATNVLRTGNKLAAFLTLVFDAGKGAVAVLVARALLGEDAAQLAGVCAFLGHLFPVWLGFKGGKGVATFLGILLALNFFVGLACCATWLVVALVFRYSSLAALLAAGISPFWMMYFFYGQAILLGLLLSILVYARHWANIKRLRAGTEPRIGHKS